MGRASHMQDSVITRERDGDAAWASAASGALDERRYYCQNRRGDVVALLKPSGILAESVRYASYGVPYRLDPADYDNSGFVDFDDYAAFMDDYDNGRDGADIDCSGFVDFDDYNAFASEIFPSGTESWGAGRSELSGIEIASRVGYAGYQWDPVINVYHVRNRVYLPETGRWGRRDPAGYIDSVNLYGYVNGWPTYAIDPSGLTLYDDAYDRSTRPRVPQPRQPAPQPVRKWYVPGNQLTPVPGKEVSETNGLREIADDLKSNGPCEYADVQCHGGAGCPRIGPYVSLDVLRQIKRRRQDPAWKDAEPPTDQYHEMDEILRTIEANTDEFHFGCCNVFAGERGQEFEDLLHELYPGTEWTGPRTVIWTVPNPVRTITPDWLLPEKLRWIELPVPDFKK